MELKYDAMKLLTADERKAIEAENAKAGWGYTYDDAVNFLWNYRYGNAKVRAAIIYRFEDVNYHTLANAMEAEDWGAIFDAMYELYGAVKAA